MCPPVLCKYHDPCSPSVWINVRILFRWEIKFSHLKNLITKKKVTRNGNKNDKARKAVRVGGGEKKDKVVRGKENIEVECLKVNLKFMKIKW